MTQIERNEVKELSVDVKELGDKFADFDKRFSKHEETLNQVKEAILGGEFNKNPIMVRLDDLETDLQAHKDTIGQMTVDNKERKLHYAIYAGGAVILIELLKLVPDIITSIKK